MLGLMLMALSGGPVFAQRGGPRGDCCGQRFDDKTVETLSGKVTKVEHIDHGNGMKGIHLVVSTGKETLVVQLGPENYVSAQGFVFAAGDKVAIEGSRVQLRGTPTLLAREVTVGGKKLVLRDKDGFPMWGGRRRGGS
jgi:hypothetical protein